MPNVKEIKVGAARTFNHPFESYSNLRPMVTVTAEVLPGEDWQEVAKSLQAQAERLVEDHKRNMLKSLEEIEDLRAKQREASNLEATLLRTQEALDRLRAGMPPVDLRLPSPDDEIDIIDPSFEEVDEDTRL